MKALSQRLPFSAVQVLVQDIAVKPEFGKFTLRVVERIEVKQIQQRLLTRGVGCRGGNVCKGAISNFNPSSSVRPEKQLFPSPFSCNLLRTLEQWMKTKGLGSCSRILISLCYNTCTIMQTILLSNEFGSIEVESLGARLVSYVPSSEREVFARLSDGTGGMPICWPWFASEGPEGCRRHGLARYHDFMILRRFESTRVSEVELILRSVADMREEFGYDFQLLVRYRLAAELTISMTGENSDTRPFSVNEMFHPYFQVGEVEDCRVTGVGDCLIGAGPRLVDLPKDSPHHYSLVDAGLGRELKFSSSGDRTVVIWNPGDNVAGSMSMTSTLEPGEWRQFVCIENGTARKEFGYVLRPGERHTLTRTIRVVKCADLIAE